MNNYRHYNHDYDLLFYALKIIFLGIRLYVLEYFHFLLDFCQNQYIVFNF